jgi:flagellar hook protein FlgE
MLGSLFAGISGLNTNSTAMTVIGDNIANVNTTAFKSNRASFANILSQSLGGGGGDIGRGVQFWGTRPLWSQGSLENTSSATDLAINGKGFFVLVDDQGNEFYTRAGEFGFDADGYLVNPDDLNVQGYTVDQNTGALGARENIQVPGNSILAPQATDEIDTSINLDSDAGYGAATGIMDSALDITAAAGSAGNITVRLEDPATAEVSSVTCTAAGLADNQYFTLNSPATSYYVWYDVDGGGVDPAPGGTGIAVNLLSTDTAAQVATKVAAAIDAVGDFSAPAPAGTTITITNASTGAVADITAGTSPFTVNTSTQGVTGVSAGSETVSYNATNSTLSVQIQDGVSTQTQIAAALAGHALIDTVTPVSGASAWNLGTGTDTVTLSGGGSADTYSTNITTYDSLGSPVSIALNFTRTQTGWDWTATTPQGSTTSSGSLVFDTAGNLTAPAANPTINITGLASGAAPLAVEWRMTDGDGAITGYASPSATNFLSQNGYYAGALQGVTISEEGYVTGSYSNGQLLITYQVMLADFPSYDGLTKLGENNYQASLDSGAPLPGTPGSGSLGSLTPKAIEMSNVDLAQEFVKMITTQRAFQANSRVITTSDEVLNELINLKR